VTLPSKRIVNIDVPEVSDFRASFAYNFFSKDERINEQGQAPAYVLNRPTEGFDAQFINKVSKVVPRLVKFDFSPIASQREEQPRLKGITIRKFLSKIQNEDKIAGKDFTQVNFQENNLDGKLFFLCKKVLENKINQANESAQQQIATTQQALQSQLARLSPIDRARLLNRLTPDSVSEELIVGALSNIQNLGASFVDERRKTEIIQESFAHINKLSLNTKINNKVIAQLLNSSIEDPFSSFGSQLSQVIDAYASTQEQMRSSTGGNANIISPDEYDFEIDYIEQFHVDPKGFEPKLFICGYIIDKWEVLPDGTLSPKTPIILDNSNITTAVDLQVKYGVTYVYSIRSVGLLEVEALSETSAFAVVSLVSSKPSSRITVSCGENVAPASPSDFDIIWDYQARAPRLSWSFPTNPQRDIKKFQVFKRASIKEPFQFIKMFDFDDSVVKTRNNETPKPELIEFNLNPIRHYLDNEFSKNSSTIYAVCSIDAHGLSSGYSMQFEVKFDAFTNKITKTLVSSSGAPKDYPNMFLNQDTFVDTIKTSNAQRVRVIFNPEYLQVLDNKGANLKLLATDQTSGSYQLQFINLDLQQQKAVKIILADRRRVP
jgi:hypothetical protein